MASRVRITQIVASVDSELAGPSYTVPRLAQSLAEADETEVILATLGSPSIITKDRVRHNRYKRDLTWAGPFKRLGASRTMRQALLTERSDILHTHGLWMMPNIYPAEAARLHGGCFLLSPRGMLGDGALKFSSMLKSAFWLARQRAAAQAVSCFHATAESEYEDIRAFGLKQPVAIIPNGIDLPKINDLPCGNGDVAAARMADPFILSLGRIHKKKALGRLITAFSKVAQKYPNWRLRIVGPDEGGHAAELARQIQALGLEKRVSIEEPVFGIEKLCLMRQAEVFALSTLHENFGMTVAESLSVETPVISTKGAPWAGLVENRCGWWVNHGIEPIAAALREVMKMPIVERQAMGVRGRVWMQRDFGWENVGREMRAVYDWLLGIGDRPECVKNE